MEWLLSRFRNPKQFSENLKISLGTWKRFSYSSHDVLTRLADVIHLSFRKTVMPLTLHKNKSILFPIFFGLLVLAVFLTGGCQSDKGHKNKRSLFAPKSDAIPGILKPSERVAMIRLKGENGRKSDDPDLKKELMEQLFEEYANSPDSMVRQEVVAASAKIFVSSNEAGRSDVNMSKGFDLVKFAAMQDEDPFVRREACHVIASWKRPESAVVLRHVARNDDDKDVQLKAVQSLAVFDDKDTIETLGNLLDHRQPALRDQAMQSLKTCTKQDFGNDVHRWKQYLAGEIPDPVHTPSLAERFRIGQLPMIY